MKVNHAGFERQIRVYKKARERIEIQFSQLYDPYLTD
ncbi:hypothetical protein J2X69_005109 [Algoriphagus sp. 4150]|nr:hypothetical protein [Algoriphagus sp. 4150]